MRRTLLIGLASVAALTACSTSKDDDTATATTAAAAGGGGATDATDAPVASDDPRAPGVTDTEIKIGITYPDLSNLPDTLGIDHGDYEAAFTAVIDHINAEGGVGGRTIVPTFAPIDPLATDAEIGACTRLTQDDPVFVVVGFVLDQENALCYLETNGTALMGGTMSEERYARADAPWFTTEGSDDASLEGIRSLSESGDLDGAVAVVGTADDQVLYESEIAPLLEELGVEPVSVGFVDTTIPDPNIVDDATETLAQRFEADGADTVLMIGGGAGGIFPRGLSRTDFRPTLIFATVSNAVLYANGEGNDLSVLPGALATGPYDAGFDFLELGGPTEECVQIMTDAGIELVEQPIPRGEPTQYTASLAACRQLEVLRVVLDAVGEDLDYGTYRAAFENLGEIELAGHPDPWNFGPPPAADGDPRIYVYEYDLEDENFHPQAD